MEYYNDEIFLEQIKTTANLFLNGVSVLQKDGENYKVLFMNDFLLSDLGYTREEALELTSESPFKLAYNSDAQRIRELLENIEDEENFSATFRLMSKDRKPIWYLMQFYTIGFNGKPCIAINHTNVQELIGTQLKLESDNNKWLDIIDSIPIGIGIFHIKNGINNTVAINHNMLNLANELGTMLDGNARAWSMSELTLIFNQSIYAFCMPEDVGKVKKMLEKSANEKSAGCIFRLRGSTEENTIYVISSCVSREHKEGGRIYYITFQDYTRQELSRLELIEKQQELYQLSYFDSLTGVHNRNAYNALMEECKTNRLSKVGIAFCDLNGLKRTNDALGHSYGDRMLKEFSGILKSYFSIENIYRISGDEFVIIIPDIDKAEFGTRMTNILQELKQANNLASVGFIWKPNVSDIRRRTMQAEEIMYVEKQRYYETAKTITSKHRPEMLDKLTRELEQGAFKMYLQPKANFNRKIAKGAEALVRKIDIDGRVVPPYEFVPQLEKEKLIPKIDFFMLEEVCKFLEYMKEINKTDFVVSVNMSRVTLVENDYLENVTAICDKYDFNRNQLEFEITESTETMDHIRLEEYIKRIKALGIGVSLDDVGTEYSSLPMLILDGIDYVKLDRSLVTQVKNEKAQKLLTHIIEMSHDLNLKVIAEGVESNSERLLLKKMNCDMYQGYYLSKPLPLDEFEEKYL